MELFTDNWGEPPVLYEGERLCHIITTNPCDSVFAIWDTNKYTETEFRIEAANTLYWQKRAQLMGFEDVTDLYCCDSTFAAITEEGAR